MLVPWGPGEVLSAGRAGTGGPGQDFGGSDVAESTQPQRGQVFFTQMPGQSPPSAGPKQNPPIHPPNVTGTCSVSLVPLPPSPRVSLLADTGLLPGFMPGRSCRHHPSERGIAAEALSLASGLVSRARLISQSDITNFLSKPLLTGSGRSSSNVWAHLGWCSLGFLLYAITHSNAMVHRDTPPRRWHFVPLAMEDGALQNQTGFAPDMSSEAPHHVDK